MKKQLTLIIIHRDPHVLLGKKKRGFGQGKWNGFGGKVMDNESIESAAVRELHEEAGVVVLESHLEKMALIDFSFENDPEVLEVHVFRVSDFSGEPQESDEMLPKWYHKDELPYDVMWVDDKHWFPLFLLGKKFRAKFHFKDHDTILEHFLEEVDALVSL